MKRLLYTVAHGAPVYLDMARVCIDSARRQGFDGDALLLSDHAHRIPDVDCRKVELEPPGGGDLLAKAALIRAMARAEIEQYDQVLFLDADCVFRAPVERVFSHSGLCVTVSAPFGGSPRAIYNFVFLTGEERMRLMRSGQRRINSGMILMPGGQAFEFLGAWESFWRECPRREVGALPRWQGYPPNLMDQPALQAMLLRSGRSWTPFPPDTMGFPLFGPWEDAAVLHFCGQAAPGLSRAEGKQVLLERMRSAAGLDGRASP